LTVKAKDLTVKAKDLPVKAKYVIYPRLQVMSSVQCQGYTSLNPKDCGDILQNYMNFSK